MEAELREARGRARRPPDALGLTTSPRPRTCSRARRPTSARSTALTAQLEGLVGKEPPETLPTLRDAAALEIEQKTSALEALGPIAKEPRARERLEVEVRDRSAPSSVRATTRRTPAPGSRRTRSTPSRSPARPSGSPLARAARRAPAPRARLRRARWRAIDAAEQATMKTRHPLPREAHGRRPRAGHRRSLPPRPGRRHEPRHRGPRAGEATTGSTVTALSQGTLDLVYLAARLGLVRLVTGDRRPPLVFDDPFVTLDDARAARALELLARSPRTSR